MNLAEILAEEGRLLGDPSHDRWSDSVLTTRTNEAQAIVQGYTNAVKTKETLTLVVDVPAISVDSDTMDITMVRILRSNGDKEKLEGITREELDYRYPNWENLGSGKPECYWFDATNGQLNVVPAADAANAITNGLEVWEVRNPAPMSGSTDVPFDSSTPMIPYGMSLVHWTVAVCFMDDGTPEALAKSRFHKSGMLEKPGEFEKHILRIREDFDAPLDTQTRILWRPQGGRVGRFSRLTKSNPLG